MAFATRSSTAAELMFVPAIVQMSFTAANSVLNGIHPMPGQFTGGDGAVTGQEVTLQHLVLERAQPARRPLLLRPASPGDERRVPLAVGAAADRAPGVPFPAGSTDLQSWIRNAALDPDWLRVGTDITHQGPFNAVFTLSGDTVAAVPEPETYALLLIGIAAIGVARARRKGR